MQVTIPAIQCNSESATYETEETELFFDLCTPQCVCQNAVMRVGGVAYSIKLYDLIQLGIAAQLCHPEHETGLKILADEP